MKKIGTSVLLALLLGSCARPVYVPQVSERYVDRCLHDSVYVHDSIHISVIEKTSGDTVYKDSIVYQLMWKDRQVHDTLEIRDSIPYPVELPPEIVYRTPGVVRMLAWVGAVTLAALLLALIRRYGR